MKDLAAMARKGFFPRFSFRFGLVFFLFLCGGAAFSQDFVAPVQPPPAPAETEAGGKESPGKIWLGYREAAQKGSWAESRMELEKLYQWKLNQGIRNHYYYAVALLRDSENLTQEAAEEMRPVLLAYAERMAPDFSEVAYAQARRIWSHQPFSLSQAARAAERWLGGGIASFANLEEALRQYALVGYALIFGFLGALGLYALLMVYRYHPFFLHHLRHFLNLDLPAPLKVLCGVLLLFLPLALGIGWLGLFLSWIVLCWIYAGRAERKVSLVLLLLVLLLPSAVRLTSSLVSAMDEGGVTEILQANNGVWSPDLYRQLLLRQQQRAADPDLLQAISLVEKRMGKFTEAENHLRRWIKMGGNAAAAYNNLGNVYLATNRIDQAMGAYQQAIVFDGSRTESYYNLGQAYLLNLLLNEAESEFRRAKELRPQLISFYTGIASRHPNRMTIDRILEPGQIWKKVFAETDQRDELAGGFFRFLGVPRVLPGAEWFGAAFLLILGAVHFGGRRRPLLRRCERCGRLTCSRCSRSLVLGNQCLQCVQAFSKNPNGDGQRLKEKRLEVARYQLRELSLSRWLSFLLPGAGHIHRGHPQEGMAYLFIGSCFLMRALLGEQWLPNPFDLGLSSAVPWIAAGLFFFAFYYFWVQFRLHQILRKEAKFYFRPAE